MNDRSYIVTRRDGVQANVTRYLLTQPIVARALWTAQRGLALRLTFIEAASIVAWWNAKSPEERHGVQARVEDADAPPPVYAEAA